jgi:hypothetical protein
MPKAPKARKAPWIREGHVKHRHDGSDELVVSTANRGEVRRKQALPSAYCGRFANRKRGCSRREAARDLCPVMLRRVTPRERTWLKGHQGVR